MQPCIVLTLEGEENALSGIPKTFEASFEGEVWLFIHLWGTSLGASHVH